MNTADGLEDIGMKAAATNRMHEPPAKRWTRHSAAVLATLMLNVLLVAFLVAWMGQSRGERPTPLWAVPVEVTDAAPEEMDQADEAPQDVAADVPAPPEPTLPVPPLPERPSVDPSPSAALPVIFEAVRAPSLDVPPYSVQVAESAPHAPAPVPGMPKAGPTPQRKVGASRGPILVQPPNLEDYYPHRARMRQVTGKTSVRLTVGADGRTTDVQILNSTPPGVFENAARRVGRSLQFRPALRNDRPAAAAVSLNLIWRLE